MSRQRLHHVRQFGAQYCKRGGVRRPLRADHQIDRREDTQQVASENLTQPAPQAIARHRRRLMTRHDEAKPRVTGGVVTPDQIEMTRTPPAACFPAGRELRTARDSHAARVPLARLPAPVFGWSADGETLAALLAAARQRSAAPNVFHPRAKSVFIDAPPISRPICRTHDFLE